MRILHGFLLVAVLCLFLASTVSGNDTAFRVKRLQTVVVTYNPTHKCVMVCRGAKPISAYLEDGLAYMLDIPLALLSPITCPIVSPLMERFDSGPNRTYARQRAGR